MNNFYLNKYSFCNNQIEAQINVETKAIVVIPCFNEPNLVRSLQSLYACDMDCCVEIIVVINCSENCSNERRPPRAQNRNRRHLGAANKAPGSRCPCVQNTANTEDTSLPGGPVR